MYNIAIAFYCAPYFVGCQVFRGQNIAKYVDLSPFFPQYFHQLPPTFKKELSHVNIVAVSYKFIGKLSY